MSSAFCSTSTAGVAFFFFDVKKLFRYPQKPLDLLASNSSLEMYYSVFPNVSHVFEMIFDMFYDMIYDMFCLRT